MFSPFEELEYLADYLPEEGETVLISREAGELVCQPWLQEDFRDGIDDSRLYGRLVQANERLHNAGAMPIWVTLMGLVWLAILLHGAIGLGWSHWYVVPGLGLPALFGCFHWIRFPAASTVPAVGPARPPGRNGPPPAPPVHPNRRGPAACRTPHAAGRTGPLFPVTRGVTHRGDSFSGAPAGTPARYGEDADIFGKSLTVTWESIIESTCGTSIPPSPGAGCAAGTSSRR
jgi:hypothetical protein